MQNKLMDATVKQNELEKFKLQIGDIAITKDSETKDDIGKSVYINDDISNCVLGYHCALIRPDKVNLDGAYLYALLHTDYAKKYFELNAGGSGQRFYLNVDIIEDMPIPLIPIDKQKQIGRLFNNIDKKIHIQ